METDGGPLVLLFQLCRRFTDIYATYVECRSALIAWRRQLEAELPAPGINRDINHVFFARKRDQSPIQHKIKTIDLIGRLHEEGPNADTLRAGAIMLAYAAWEDGIRHPLEHALELGRNEVLNDTLGDLNSYRQAIAHVDGRLDRQTKVFAFIDKGEPIKLTDDQFYELFRLLIEAVNDLGETYVGIRPPYSLDKLGWWPK